MRTNLPAVVKQFEVCVLTSFLIGVMAGCGPEAPGQSQQGITQGRYVLVHGATQGSWVWEDVAQKLRSQGAAVTVVNLPAHGTDPLPAAYATLDAYVQAVSAAVHNGDSLPVHLVGHSLGGMVISQFAESDPSSVQDLVYVAGMLPTDGQTSVALFDTSSYVIQHMYVNYTDLTVGVSPGVIGPGFCADCSAKQLAFLQGNFREEPLLPLLTPVSLTAANFGSVTKKYVFTTDDQTITHPFQQAMAATAALARTATITSSHQAQTSHAGQLTDILLDLTR